MAKRESFLNILTIPTYLILTFIYNTNLSWQIPLIHSIVGTIRLVLYCREINYYDLTICKLVFATRTINSLLPFFIFLYSYFGRLSTPGYIEFTAIVIVPLLCGLAFSIRNLAI